MMPTIKDVAEKAGVGIATVSRAMNGTGYVSARSREKIETAIRELHYIPNERARNLSRKQTDVTKPVHSILWNFTENSD